MTNLVRSLARAGVPALWAAGVLARPVHAENAPLESLFDRGWELARSPIFDTVLVAHYMPPQEHAADPVGSQDGKALRIAGGDHGATVDGPAGERVRCEGGELQCRHEHDWKKVAAGH